MKIFRPGLPATLLIAELFDTIFVVIIKYMWLELNLNNIKKFDQKSCDILMIYRIFSCSANGPLNGGRISRKIKFPMVMLVWCL